MCCQYYFMEGHTAGNTWDSVAFASTFTVTTTGIYYLYFIYQESAQTTAPVIGQCAPVLNIACFTLDFKNTAFLVGQELTQTILPATRLTSAFTVITTPPFVGGILTGNHKTLLIIFEGVNFKVMQKAYF